MTRARHIGQLVLIWAAMFIPLAGLATWIMVDLYNKEAVSTERDIETREMQDLEVTKEVTSRELASIMADFLYLVKKGVLLESLAEHQAKNEIERDLTAFSDQKTHYLSVRLYNAQKKRILFADFSEASTHMESFPKDIAEGSAEDLWLKEVFSFGRGEILLSRGMENQEKAPNSQSSDIALGSLIRGSNGQTLGALMLEFHLETLFSHLETIYRFMGSEVAFLNSESQMLFFIPSVIPGSKDQMEKIVDFTTISPSLLQSFAGNLFGVVKRDGGTFFFNTISLLPSTNSSGVKLPLQFVTLKERKVPDHLKIVTFIEREEIQRELESVTGEYALMGYGLALIILAATFYAARTLMQKKRSDFILRDAMTRFKDVSNCAVTWIWETDMEGRISFSAGKVEAFTGFGAEILLGKILGEVLGFGETGAPDPECTRRVIQGGPMVDEMFWYSRPGGKSICLLGNGLPIADKNGKRTGFRGVFKDITDIRGAQLELQHANQRLSHSISELESRNQEIASLNKLSDLLQACRKMEEMYKVIEQSAIELFPGDSGILHIYEPSQHIFLRVSHWGESDPFDEVLESNDCWALRRGKENFVPHHTEAMCLKVAGKVDHGHIGLPIIAHGEVLGLLHLVFAPPVKGMTDEKRLQLLNDKRRLAVTMIEQVALTMANLKLGLTLANQSLRDPLTGLFNRRYMEESLNREINRARRQRSTISIIMTDVDHFKRFNDTYGHEAGDLVLKELSALFAQHVRSEDIPCRFGGEEFMLILPGATLADGLARAENLRMLTETALKLHHAGRDLGKITISLGVAVFPAHGDKADILIAAADSALYKSKDAGRNRVTAAE